MTKHLVFFLLILLAGLGSVNAFDPPAALQRYVKSEILRWGKIVQQAGLAGSE